MQPGECGGRVQAPAASHRCQPPPAGGQWRGLGPPAALAHGRVKRQPARVGADWRACRARGTAATAVESPSWRWGALTLLAALLCRCQQCRSQQQRQERRRRPHSSCPTSVARSAPASIAAAAAHAFLKCRQRDGGQARPKLRQSPSTCPSPLRCRRTRKTMHPAAANAGCEERRGWRPACRRLGLAAAVRRQLRCLRAQAALLGCVANKPATPLSCLG